MAEIPDDVVERAAQICRDNAPPWFPKTQKWKELPERVREDWRNQARAALRVGMEWERSRCEGAIKQYAAQIEKVHGVCIRSENILEGIDAIRSRTNPDDCNPSDYT